MKAARCGSGQNNELLTTRKKGLTEFMPVIFNIRANIEEQPINSDLTRCAIIPLTAFAYSIVSATPVRASQRTMQAP